MRTLSITKVAIRGWPRDSYLHVLINLAMWLRKIDRKVSQEMPLWPIA